MKIIRDADCPLPNAYYMDSKKVGIFPVEPGTLPFSDEHFEVSGEGKELRSAGTLTLGCRISPMNATGIEAVSVDIRIDYDGTVHFPDGYPTPTDSEIVLIRGFQAVIQHLNARISELERKAEDESYNQLGEDL